MSLQPPDKMPKVPNTMDYTEDEKALASSVQARNRRFGHAPLVALAGTVATAVIGGGAYFVTRGGDADPTSGRPTESTSGHPNNPENSQSGEVAQDPKDLSALDTPASAEQIKEALKPVTNKEYPTADKALVRIGELWNVNMLSAEIDPNDYKLETTESAETQENIFRNIFGDNYGVPGSFDEEEDASHMRHNIAGAFDYSIEQLEQDPHWQMSFSIDNITDNGNDTFSFTGSYTVKQDLAEKVFGLEDTFFSPEAQQSEYSYNISGSLELSDGIWHLQSISFG